MKWEEEWDCVCCPVPAPFPSVLQEPGRARRTRPWERCGGLQVKGWGELPCPAVPGAVARHSRQGSLVGLAKLGSRSVTEKLPAANELPLGHSRDRCRPESWSEHLGLITASLTASWEGSLGWPGVFCMKVSAILREGVAACPGVAHHIRVPGRCVLCRQAGLAPTPACCVLLLFACSDSPSPPGGPLARRRVGLGLGSRLPAVKLVPVGSVISNRDTIPGSPNHILLLLFLTIAGVLKGHLGEGVG